MKTYSLEEVALIVEDEGLGYAVQDYLNPDRIEDKELQKKWKQAQDLLNEINNILKPYKF